MGKSPGKWFKSVLLKRKSSNSKWSKGNDMSKSANKGETLVSSKAHVPDTTVDHSTISQLSPAVVGTSGGDSKHVIATDFPREGFTFSCAQGDENPEAVTNLGSREDPEGIRHEIAATKAQAAVRGYLARRSFRTLKGIIRLQALIRGHLVRRQAAATLYSVRAIVKLQAMARGQKVRRSAIGIEVQKTCDLGKIQNAICSVSSGIYISTLSEKLIKNVFAQKLLASSPGAIPLSLHYSPEEPNSSLEWLERWTKSRFWESHSQPKKNAEQKVETEQGRKKRSIRKPFRGNTENNSFHSTKESEKPKHNPRKVSSHTKDSVQEHMRYGFEKTNRNLRKTSDSTKEAPERFGADNGKPKHSVRKSSTVTVPEVPEGTNDMAVVITKISDVDGSPKLPAGDGHVSALQERQDLDLQPIGNNIQAEDIQGTIKQLNPEHYNTCHEDQKTSDRRASFPPNIENQENGVCNTAKVPSYMAPTKSARAKLRGQGSPRFSQDAIENIGTIRRHSLPSSTNGKLNPMSPRAPKPVHAASKGGIRSDRSLSASRDGIVSDKAIKAGWRR